MEKNEFLRCVSNTLIINGGFLGNPGLYTPIDYKLGITGIGTTFEYLVQKGFIEANTDDILKDVDEKIFSIQNLPYLSLDEF